MIKLCRWVCRFMVFLMITIIDSEIERRVCLNATREKNWRNRRDPSSLTQKRFKDFSRLSKDIVRVLFDILIGIESNEKKLQKDDTIVKKSMPRSRGAIKDLNTLTSRYFQWWILLRINVSFYKHFMENFIYNNLLLKLIWVIIKFKLCQNL